MKTLSAALILAAALTSPAIADTASNVTLVLENDAGMVTQLPDLTQRECDAITALLIPRKPQLGTVSGFYISGTLTMNPGPAKSATSKLTTVRCVLPTDK